MNRKCWTTLFGLACAVLSGGDSLMAASPDPMAQLKAKMQKEGWKMVTDGVFERQLGANKIEHLGYGREGLAWTVGDLSRRLERLQKEQERYPSERLAKIIDDLSYQVAKARKELWNLDQNPQGLSQATAAVTGPSCSSICYSATADAYELTTAQGVGAVAHATFNSACGHSGETFAYAYARATLNGTTTTVTQSDPHS